MTKNAAARTSRRLVRMFGTCRNMARRIVRTGAARSNCANVTSRTRRVQRSRVVVVAVRRCRRAAARAAAGVLARRGRRCVGGGRARVLAGGGRGGGDPVGDVRRADGAGASVPLVERRFVGNILGQGGAVYMAVE